MASAGPTPKKAPSSVVSVIRVIALRIINTMTVGVTGNIMLETALNRHKSYSGNFVQNPAREAF